MLLAAKLRALLKRYWPEVASAEPTAAAGGMAVHRDGRAWALVDDTDPGRGFARALLWGLHRDAAEVHVLSEDSPALGAAARQAACFPDLGHGVGGVRCRGRSGRGRAPPG